MHRWQRRLLIIMCMASLVQCAKKDTEDAKVDFKITPETPLVINADFKYDPNGAVSGDEISVSANWFRFGFTVVNSSTRPVTIAALNFTVTGTDSTGRLVSGTVSTTSSNWHDGTAATIGTVLGEIAAGATLTRDANFYLSSLPKDVRGLLYSVRVEVVGWFGTEAEPVDRLNKTYYFNTR